MSPIVSKLRTWLSQGSIALRFNFQPIRFSVEPESSFRHNFSKSRAFVALFHVQAPFHGVYHLSKFQAIRRSRSPIHTSVPTLLVEHRNKTREYLSNHSLDHSHIYVVTTPHHHLPANFQAIPSTPTPIHIPSQLPKLSTVFKLRLYLANHCSNHSCFQHTTMSHNLPPPIAGDSPHSLRRNSPKCTLP